MSLHVISAQEAQALESRAYKRGFCPEAFMDLAGKGIADFIATQKPKNIALLAGKGNNAGDGYRALSLLCQQIPTVSFQIGTLNPLASKKQSAYKDLGGTVIEVQKATQFVFPSNCIILDGIFGIGFKGVVEGLFAAAIMAANTSQRPIFAIDIPSGVDGTLGTTKGPAIFAKYTLSCGHYKKGFFLADGFEHCGTIIPIDFGLPKDTQPESFFSYLRPPPLRPLKRCRHKYDAGEVLAVGGVMPGAISLTTKAAFRTGAGLVRIYHNPPQCYYAPPEAIYSPLEDIFIRLKVTPSHRRTVVAGPGLGVSAKSQAIVDELCQLARANTSDRFVFDADALTLLKTPPQGSLLTPHIGEMKRLLDNKTHCGPVDGVFLDQCIAFAKATKTAIYLKGAVNFLIYDERVTISTCGDTGMATAGSGDVLAGIVSGLLCQDYSMDETLLLGAFLHGKSGEYAAKRLGSHSLMASDIIQSLPEVFTQLLGTADDVVCTQARHSTSYCSADT